MSNDELKQTMPSWHLKQIGARMVVYAIERFGAGFYKKLGEALGLNEVDLELVMKEVDTYYERASCRCPHLEDVEMKDFKEKLNEAKFSGWSESAKMARASKKGA